MEVKPIEDVVAIVQSLQILLIEVLERVLSIGLVWLPAIPKFDAEVVSARNCVGIVW